MEFSPTPFAAIKRLEDRNKTRAAKNGRPAVWRGRKQEKFSVDSASFLCLPH
jgi:hypothetical protein